MKRFKPTTILEYILLTLLAGLFLFPMVWMVVSAMKPEADVYKNLTSWQAFLPSLNPADWFKPYQEVFERFSIFTYLGNSIFYAGTFAIGSIIVNALAGFAFAKVNFSGKKILFGFLLALLIIPVEPEEILESAKMDGASIVRIFFRIMLPMSKPAVATVGVLSFISSWNDYIWPLMVLTDSSKFSMQVAITTINTTQPVYINQVMAVLTISTIPLILVYVVAQKYIVQGLGGSGTGIK